MEPRDYDSLSKDLSSEGALRKREISHLTQVMNLDFDAYPCRQSDGTTVLKFSNRKQYSEPYGWAVQCNKRALYLIAYSHWEGYTKSSLSRYLEFLDHLKDSEKDVHPNLTGYLGSSQVPRLNSGDYDLRNSDASKAANTKSNLGYELFDRLCKRFDLPFPQLIEENQDVVRHMLSKRNGIAHGDTEARYTELIDEDDEMLSKTVHLVNESLTVIQETILVKADEVLASTGEF